MNKAGPYGDTLLHSACDNGCIEIVKLLVEKNADVNKSNMDWITPLHIALTSNKIDIYNFLVDNGATKQLHALILY